jgi:hypothetical protein
LGILFAGKITNPRDLKEILETAQNEFELRIKKIRSDNGTKFKSSQIEGFLEEEGIKHEFSSPYWIWQGPCLMSTRLRISFGRRQLTPLATPSTGYTFTEFSRRHHMNSSLVKSSMFHTLEFLGQMLYSY